MSLREPILKMSKSNADERSRILLTDTSEEVYRKIKGALTDSEPQLTYDPNGRPGVSNLIEILSHLEGRSCNKVAMEFQSSNIRVLKEHIASKISCHLQPIREKYLSLMGDRTGYLESVAEQGAQAARSNSEATMRQVKGALGL